MCNLRKYVTVELGFLGILYSHILFHKKLQQLEFLSSVDCKL